MKGKWYLLYNWPVWVVYGAAWLISAAVIYPLLDIEQLLIWSSEKLFHVTL